MERSAAVAASGGASVASDSIRVMDDQIVPGSRVIVLVIPDCPKSMNRSQMRTHWAVAQREKKRWQNLFETELMVQRVPRGMRFCTVQVHVEWKKHRRRDVSNWYGPITKSLYDALVSGGYLPDDTAEFIALKGITFEEPADWPYQDPRLQARMTVTLEAEYPERSS